MVWAYPILNSPVRNPIFANGQQTLSFLLLSLIWLCSMLRTHPRSTYAHDAKWGMFAFWLAAAAQQVAGICFDLRAIAYSFSVFQFGWGVPVCCAWLDSPSIADANDGNPFQRGWGNLLFDLWFEYMDTGHVLQLAHPPHL